MAGTVDVVQTTASGAGAAVAVDRVTSADYQQVKLVAGSIGVATPIDATTGIPGATMMGIVVAPIAGATVTVSGTIPVTGAVSVSGVVPVTTQASVSVTALPVWWSPTAQVALSSTVLSVNTAPTVAGASVTIQQGASVIASIQNVTPVTTAASVSVSGVPVWWNPTAQVVVSGLQGASVTGSVNIVSTAIVSLATGGSVTLVGTVGASIVAAVSLSGIALRQNASLRQNPLR